MKFFLFYLHLDTRVIFYVKRSTVNFGAKKTKPSLNDFKLRWLQLIQTTETSKADHINPVPNDVAMASCVSQFDFCCVVKHPSLSDFRGQVCFLSPEAKLNSENQPADHCIPETNHNVLFYVPYVMLKGVTLLNLILY